MRARRSDGVCSIFDLARRTIGPLRMLVRPPRWAPLIFRVNGDSMSPTFEPGDWLWVDARSQRKPRPEDLVVVRHPRSPERILVKRVRSCGDRAFSVGSDNPAQGEDSRHFGPLDASHLIGRVVFAWPRRSPPSTRVRPGRAPSGRVDGPRIRWPRRRRDFRRPRSFNAFRRVSPPRSGRTRSRMPRPPKPPVGDF